MATLTLDVCFPEDVTLEDACNDLVDAPSGLLDAPTVTWRETGVRVGGGWPEVEFTGTAVQLAIMLVRYADGTSVDLPYLLSRVNE